MADPLMTLLTGALKLWIRTRCDQLGSLELTLHGSAFTLMSGRLQGVSLIARDVGLRAYRSSMFNFVVVRLLLI